MAVYDEVEEALESGLIKFSEDDTHADIARELIDEGHVNASFNRVRCDVGRYRRNADIEDEIEVDLPEEPVGLEVVGEHDPRYIREGDYWKVYIPYLGKIIKVDGQTDREMKRAYTNEVGNGKTIKEVATQFGWDENIFKQYKRARDWVHSDIQYTDEEMLDRETDDLVHTTLAEKKQEYIVERNKEEWRQIKQDAQNYQKLKQGRLDPLAEYVVNNPPYESVPSVDIKCNDYLPVFNPSDLHIGKLGIDGYDIQTAWDRVLESTEYFCDRLCHFGRPEKAIVTLGNDWWHVDNKEGMTSNGTPQDVDGVPESIIAIGYDLAAKVTDKVREIADEVIIYVVKSNHCHWSEHHLQNGLRLAYRNIDSVNVNMDTSPRLYYEYGQNLIGFEHGDGAKDSKLPMIMADEKKEAWGRTSHRYFLTGHLHHLSEKDRGVTIMQAPSLSGDDRWHEKQGYVLTDKANICYVFDRELGNVDRMIYKME